MKLSNKIRIFIILLIAGFCAFCACFMSSCAEYIAEFMTGKGIAIPEAAVYIVGALLCLPCLVLLVIAWQFGGVVERDEVFTPSTAKTLLLISWIFFTDCALFLCGIAVMFALGEMLLAPIFALIDLIGFGIGVLLRILADYIRRAAELKEEVEGTL